MAVASMDSWYVLRDGKASSPFPAAKIAQLHQAGKLRPDDMLAIAGDNRWMTLAEAIPLVSQAAVVAAAPAAATRPQQPQQPRAQAPVKSAAAASQAWSFERDGQRFGPYTPQEMAQYAKEG